jgi:isoleucyl-tRNA synthetase
MIATCCIVWIWVAISVRAFSRYVRLTGGAQDAVENTYGRASRRRNVKTVVFTAEVAGFGSRDIKVNSKLGAKLGAKFKEVLAAQRARAWIVRADGRVEIAGIVLDQHDFELRIRLVQTTRKQAAYNVTDRIGIAASVSPELAHAFNEFNSYVKRETLAVAFDFVTDDAFDCNARVIEDELDHYRVKFSIDRVAWRETE